MLMKRLFGAKRPEPEPIDPEKSLSQLRDRARECEQQLEDKLALGRRLFQKGDKDKARIVMMEHKKLQQEAASLARNLSMLQQQEAARRDIENKKTVVDVMRVQNQRMKEAASGLAIENVDAVVEEMDDLLGDVTDVSHALDERFDALLPNAIDSTDDDSLFGIFEQEEVSKTTLAFDAIPALPARTPVLGAATVSTSSSSSSAPMAKASAVQQYDDDWM